jgi:ribonuclease D
MLVPAAGSLDGNASSLFERLRAWRDALATAEQRPHYTVLADATLRAIAVTRPQSDDELLAIPGIAAAKLARYGAGLRALVSAHIEGVDGAPSGGVPSHVAAADGGESARSYHAERVAEARQLHPRAFERWTDAEDGRLRSLVGDRRSVNEIAGILQRQPNAVRLRADRLGLSAQLGEEAPRAAHD